MTSTAPQLRVVAIGAAAHIFGAAHAPALQAIGAEVVGAYDVNPSLLRRVAQGHGWPVYEELAQLLDVPADLAVITTPHPTHSRLILECVRAGRDVLVEKPVAVAVDEVDSILKEAQSRNRVVAVALQQRFRREVQEAKRLLDSGAIGELHRIESVAYYPKRSLYYTDSAWRGTWAGEGGGVLINQGQHDLDLMIHLAGLPTEAFGWMRTRLQPTETEDTVEAIVSWAGGATGSIHVSSAAVDGSPRIHLIGTGGTMRISANELELATNESDMREFAADLGDPFDRLGIGSRTVINGGGGSHEDVYRDLRDALISGAQPLTSLSNASGALELTNALTLSSHTGRPVSLPLPRADYRQLLNDLLDGSQLRERSLSHAQPVSSPDA